MHKFILPVFAFLLFSNLGHTQRKIKGKELTVIGTILDKETKQPLEYATVSFLVKLKIKSLKVVLPMKKVNLVFPFHREFTTFLWSTCRIKPLSFLVKKSLQI
ncbi:hypothetical protein [Pseudotamlana carrageenivorans]|uniref:hypothetical protein n=1 Tax=Pseudotamlana carrageenivorans TaxID=2069432 RepID=UPI001F535E2E|nr:hypothetical protein [Tamlana carrageenivorans]